MPNPSASVKGSGPPPIPPPSPLANSVRNLLKLSKGRRKFPLPQNEPNFLGQGICTASKHRSDNSDNPGEGATNYLPFKTNRGYKQSLASMRRRARNAEKTPTNKAPEHRDHLKTEAKRGQQRTHPVYTEAYL